MKKVKILIVCPWWGRWEVTKIHSRNMKKFMSGCPYSIEYLVIISPDDPDYQQNTNTAFKNGFQVCEFRNLPISQKLNAGINYGIEKFDPDYIMNMGSDDLCCTSIWPVYKPYIDGNNLFFGVDSGHAINFYTKEVIYLDLYNDMHPVGGLRMIHTSCIRKLIQESGFSLYPNNINSGMDTASMDRLRKIGIQPEIIHSEGRVFIAGLKCNTTINHWIHLSTAVKYDRNVVKKVEYDDVKHLICD